MLIQIVGKNMNRQMIREEINDSEYLYRKYAPGESLGVVYGYSAGVRLVSMDCGRSRCA